MIRLAVSVVLFLAGVSVIVSTADRLSAAAMVVAWLLVIAAALLATD